MTVLIYLLIAAALLLLNAFFVLAEFAAVKMRGTRVEELTRAGVPQAKLVGHVQSRLDEYLSVCQVGITFASIGLGFVGEPAFAALIMKAAGASEAVSHGLAVGIAYVLVSFLHILLGELVPKSLAIRRAERAALLTARPLTIFRILFYPPLILLNGSANLILRLFGIPPAGREKGHTEEELRILLGRSQSSGTISFRRLLLMENVFDLGDLFVRDAMRSRSAARVLRASASWEENLAVLRESRFSRYPLMEEGDERPVGIVHVKDLLYTGPGDLRKLARPYATAREDSPLEVLLADLQRRRSHMVIVVDGAGGWTGIVTFEDIIEEIIGTIEDEFEVDPPLFIADTLTPGRIVLGVEAPSLPEAVRAALAAVPDADLPLPRERIVEAVIERELKMTTYLGRGIAIPHARFDGIERPVMVIARSSRGIPLDHGEERARLLFILMTPVKVPRAQARLLARIGGLMDSEYVVERLMQVATPQEFLDTVRTGDPVALS